jgi:hypothetical protein
LSPESRIATEGEDDARLVNGLELSLGQARQERVQRRQQEATRLMGSGSGESISHAMWRDTLAV